MSRKQVQFGIAATIILGTLTWLAVSGVKESQTYYVTIKELQGMGDEAYAKRLRVAGNVQPGSIKRNGKKVEFILLEEGKTLPILYTGTQPLPDTFVDSSQALADGRYNRDGVFEANQIQAKCASKYEADPSTGGQKPMYQNPQAPGSKPLAPKDKPGAPETKTSSSP